MLIQVLSKEYANRRAYSGMHNLRWDVFVNRLGWKDGLTDVNYMEMDCYDNENAVYLVEQSTASDVTAAVRLIPTDKPYMIKEYYPEFVYKDVLPEDSKVFEISRFCFAGPAFRRDGQKPAASLAIACVEYGLVNGLESYIGLTHVSVKKLMAQVGWKPSPLGEPQLTPDNTMSVVCSYAVNEETLATLKMKNNISEDTLYNSNDLTHSLMESFRRNKDQMHQLISVGVGGKLEVSPSVVLKTADSPV